MHTIENNNGTGWATFSTECVGVSMLCWDFPLTTMILCRCFYFVLMFLFCVRVVVVGALCVDVFLAPFSAPPPPGVGVFDVFPAPPGPTHRRLACIGVCSIVEKKIPTK